MNTAADPTGTIEKALTHARRLLEDNPVLAAEQAAEILKVVPNHPLATLLLAAARRLSGDAASAVAILERLAAEKPTWAAAHYELGVALIEVARRDGALAALRRAVALQPDMPDAWRDIGDLLTLVGDQRGADAAYARHIRASTKDPRLLSAASAGSPDHPATAATRCPPAPDPSARAYWASHQPIPRNQSR